MAAASPPPTPTFVEDSIQVLYYLGLSVALGLGMAIAALVIPRSRGGLACGLLRRLALPAAVFVAATALLHFLAAAAAAAKTGLAGAPSWKVLTDYVDAPGRDGSVGAGTVALVQLGGYAVAIAGLLWLRANGSRVSGGVLAGSAAITALLPEMPLSAPTAGQLAGDVLTITHVLGALVWIGGLVVLAAAGLAGRRHSDPGDPGPLADEWRQVWERFSVAALFAVGALVVSGAWLAWVHVGAPAQFVTTAYGRYLGIKLVLVVSLLVAGAYNVRVLIPRIRAARERGDTRAALTVAAHHFPVVVAVESLVATAILFIVPFLRGSARSQADWPNASPFDVEVFGTGLLLVALVGAALWLGTRSSLLDRTAAGVGVGVGVGQS